MGRSKRGRRPQTSKTQSKRWRHYCRCGAGPFDKHKLHLHRMQFHSNVERYKPPTNRSS